MDAFFILSFQEKNTDSAQTHPEQGPDTLSNLQKCVVNIGTVCKKDLVLQKVHIALKRKEWNRNRIENDHDEKSL